MMRKADSCQCYIYLVQIQGNGDQMPVISADASNTISALLIYNQICKGSAGSCGLDGTSYGADPYKAIAMSQSTGIHTL
ncbi:hypothetical protein PILCRDRAFT_491373 [Piloderma croceum F 1598]|uniref:Uncharacterized protein n=1 Tax=Piloderma croceum (strain F 1598) TaxID=765440 RepID=A0A0C3FRP7_PILCF|nr:hypothetical protein PILCRDRAFT_491373 [Piloderma croceum F 1598]